MRRRTLRSSAVCGLRLAALVASGAAAASCHEPLDTTRRAPPSVAVGHGLGDDVFGMLCDRVGASSLVEDPTGASYQRVCHYDREGRYEEEGWRLRKDGSKFWANVAITALHDETGRLRGFAKLTRDLSDRKRAESLAADGQHREEGLCRGADSPYPRATASAATALPSSFATISP